MKRKRLIAGGMLAVMLLSTVSTDFTAMAETVENAENSTEQTQFNNEGVWLTEIYQNDVDRSSAKDTRVTSGYKAIKTYSSNQDLMEFIEITSTYQEEISLNDLYDVYYGNQKLTVTDMEGNSDITLDKGEALVIWNERSDIEGSVPTEAEFREEMKIPDSAKVVKVETATNWATTAEFSIVRKSDNTVVSEYQAVDKTDTQDGFSVELKIPNLGSTMEAYRTSTLPSAGYVYSGQLNGLVTVKVPDDTKASGLYITEIRPNDVDRSSEYVLTDDLMEALEIVNTTDQDINLNDQYEIDYVVKEGYRKAINLTNYDLSTDNIVIKAGQTAVLWCDRRNSLTNYPTNISEEAFRTAYSISEDTPVYVFTNQNGLNNTQRAFEIYKKCQDGSLELTSSYTYNGTADLKDNKSVDLLVNPEGPEMLVYGSCTTSSLGNVAEAQYTFVKDDGSSISLTLDDTVPESVDQGEEIRVNFAFEQTGELPRTGITLYYRFDGEGKWYSSTETTRRVPGLYEAMISADQLFSHEYVEFYVAASNRYRSTLSDIYKVTINQLNDFEGVRTNISDNEEVSGTVTITANAGDDNSDTVIMVDGKQVAAQPMLENGAYFCFDAEGRDSYFKNAVTTTDNELIANIIKWQYRTLNGQALLLDNQYFTYNEETKTYDVTVRFWSGTYSATIEDYLMPDANREDFTATNLALKLINGKTYYPTKIGPDDSATSAKTNLSTSYTAVHSIGDSAGMCPYMDVSFSVPSSEVTAVGYELDTTQLTEGEHELIVSNGDDATVVKFIVDNTAPEINLGVEDNQALTGNISLAPQVTDNNSIDTVAVTLDGEVISEEYTAEASELGEGTHTLSVYAKDKAGNETYKTVDFVISDLAISNVTATTDNITDSSATLNATAQSKSETNAKFYLGSKIDAADITCQTKDGILPYIQYTLEVGDVDENESIVAGWNGQASNTDDTHASTMYIENVSTGKWDKVAKADSDGNIADTKISVKNHVKDGKANIIIQCTADSALPDTDATTDNVTGTNSDWDGTSVPEDYDFAFAWETDTQYYAEEWQNHFINMNNWIVDSAEDLKIDYIIHTGDIVDDYDMTYQWENADEAMQILDDSGISYGVLTGNHDVAGGAEEYEAYTKYFGESRFSSQSTYGGTYKDNLGHYDLISEKGQDFIIIYMGWDIYQDEIDWMNEILSKYSDRKAILCFHTYTNVRASNGTLLDYFGQMIQKYVVAKNPNVFAVLNGHYHGSSYETTKFDDDNDGVKERTVYQICTDYQSGFEGGSEYVKMLYFDMDNGKIYINSYSPYLDDYNFFDTEVNYISEDGAMATGVDAVVLDMDYDTASQTLVTQNFDAYLMSDSAVETAKVDSATAKTSVTVSKLEADTDYIWYAALTNANTGKTVTDFVKFTSAEVSKVPEASEKEIDEAKDQIANEESGKSEDTGSTETSPKESVSDTNETSAATKTATKTTFKYKNGKYKITSDNTVEFIGVTKSVKTLTVPSSITVDGNKYKVTKIASKAFYNNKKLRSIKLGSNISSIGKKAFKGMSSKLVIKVSSKKLKTYKKLLKKAGLKKSIKVKAK